MTSSPPASVLPSPVPDVGSAAGRGTRFGRILRIELRRSAALLTGVLILAVSLAYLHLLTGPWTHGDERWTAGYTAAAWWQRELLMFLWPGAVVAGAVQGLRDHRSRMSELLATASRPGRHRAAGTATAFALTLTVAYLLVFLSGVVRVLADNALPQLSWLPILAVGVLALIAGGWLGMGIARTVPSRFTPPALGVVTLMGAVLLSGYVLPDPAPQQVMLLSPALVGPPSAFLTVAWQTSAGQALWLLGMAATGFLLLATVGRRAPRAVRVRARLFALVPMALGAAVALPVLPGDRYDTYIADASVTEPVCEGRVCVTRLHESRLDGFAGPAEEALRLLSRLPGAPTSVREAVRPWPPGAPVRRDAAVLPVDFEVRHLDGATPEETTRALLAGAGTAPCLDPHAPLATEEQERAYDEKRAVREWAARTVSAAWFTGELKPLPGLAYLREDAGVLARPAWEALRALPAGEQRERIVALRDATLTCGADLTVRGGERDLLTVLTDGMGGGARAMGGTSSTDGMGGGARAMGGTDGGSRVAGGTSGGAR
ncbi:hypothetical protein ACIQ7D_22280 [Streptomyces sp. NPDC096310]|uniref:hypothetical protein n=1 Tax=Streptomyces sp. NPDC096310 TaxID=3366082 RepID=UPI0037FAFF9F